MARIPREMPRILWTIQLDKRGKHDNKYRCVGLGYGSASGLGYGIRVRVCGRVSVRVCVRVRVGKPP